MKTAFLFPGQGSQSVGMGRDLYERFLERVERFYERANEVLGFNLKELILDGLKEKLKLTEFAQPAILLDSIIKFELLQRKPDYAAGHSLGEYSALVAAGVLKLEDALMLLNKRGRYMQEAVPVGQGGMVALMRIEYEKVRTICAQTGAEIANYNSPQQIVISGRREAVLAAKKMAEENKGAGMELPVSAPFHSSLMKPAEAALKADIAKVHFANPIFPVISTVSGEPETDGAKIKEFIMTQITAPVRWTEYILKLKSLGVSKCVEVGPGDVLTKLGKRIDKDLKFLAFSEEMV